MYENTVILLKKNSPIIRDEIKSNGIDVCACAEFPDSIWLNYYPSVGNVHGIGYAYEDMDKESTIAFIEYEWEKYDTRVIECKNVHEFIKEIIKSGYGNKIK